MSNAYPHKGVSQKSLQRENEPKNRSKKDGVEHFLFVDAFPHFPGNAAM
jgi:hypothetical protein